MPDERGPGMPPFLASQVTCSDGFLFMVYIVNSKLDDVTNNGMYHTLTLKHPFFFPLGSKILD